MAGRGQACLDRARCGAICGAGDLMRQVVRKPPQCETRPARRQPSMSHLKYPYVGTRVSRLSARDPHLAPRRHARTRMSDFIIFIAKKILKNAQNFAICEFFWAGFPTRAARRTVYLKLRDPFVFLCAETCPKKLTYRGFLCQNEKFRGNNNY